MKHQTAVELPIWVVRSEAFSIQCGGLERLFIYFTKPTYVYQKMTENDRDIPFGYITESNGLFRRIGWIEPSEKMWVKPISVGNWFGYENEISENIWEKLKEHFHNEPFDNWHNVEREGRSKVEDFCLELNISISLNNK
jgi:hypothetical protein